MENIGEVVRAQGVLEAIGTWLMMLAPVCGGVMFTYHAFMKMQASDEFEMRKHVRQMKVVLVGVALALGAGGLINWFGPTLVPKVQLVDPNTGSGSSQPICIGNICTQ